MVNIYQSHFCNTMVACLTTIAFTTATITPSPLTAAGDIDLNAVNFGIKVEKIVEKIKNYIDKGKTNKIVGSMFDLKHEVEQYTGKKIDIDKQIDQAQREAKAKGRKINENI